MINCNDIKLIETDLQQAELHITNTNFQTAIEVLNKGIEIIGDHYVCKDVLESTGMKLVLANAEETKRNFEVAANLKRNVLDTRIKLAKQKFNCE